MSGVSQSPFDATLFNNAGRRRHLLGLIGEAKQPARLTKFSAMMSASDISRTAAYSISFADQKFCEDAVKAVLRERRACAELASRFSTEAANAILQQPLPTVEGHKP